MGVRSGRSLWAGALGACLALGGARASWAGAPQEIAGVYDCDGGSYHGRVSISRFGESYRMRWKVGPTFYHGVGIREGDRLSASWFTEGGLLGVVVYKIEPGPRLRGRYSIFPGAGKLASETLTFKKPLAALPAPRRWKTGEMALVSWSRDQYWYPATVVEEQGGNYLVLFQDGDKEWTDAARMLPEDIRPGDKVFARFRQGPAYYPGVVRERKGQALHILYDDGDQESTTLAVVRVERPREE